MDKGHCILRYPHVLQDFKCFTRCLNSYGIVVQRHVGKFSEFRIVKFLESLILANFPWSIYGPLEVAGEREQKV